MTTVDDSQLFAFVLMPFEPQFDDLYKLGIKAPAAELGILAERVDEQIYQEGILDRIYRQIELADVVIADMTGQNANVFYEVGYAHGKGKLCILLTSDAADIPFDLKHKRHIVYGGSILTLKSRLAEELGWARTEIENIQRSRVQVKVKTISGDLTVTKFSALGELTFDLDLLNESDKASAELESAYFYTSNDWRAFQDDKLCPSTDSDLQGFGKRHFLAVPVRRLHKNAWARLTFSTKKYFAFAHRGEEMKDKYHVNGRSVLRLVTAEGNYDYEIPVTVVVEEVPF